MGQNLVNETSCHLKSSLECMAQAPLTLSCPLTQCHMVQAAHHQAVEDVALQVPSHAAMAPQVQFLHNSISVRV